MIGEALVDVTANATSGAHSLAALEMVGAMSLADKVLLDVAVPIDLSRGLPPTLVSANTDSLGEQIQRAFPRSRVVKSLNTVNYRLMVAPGRLATDHSVFIAGDDRDAKRVVHDLLGEFGWPDRSIVDLGGIGASRATEMYSRLFFELFAAIGGPEFNINVVRN
ncbi:putative dinucleotide-binding enzyme [Microbacterium sp. BE35]|uniref:NADPH-dependent F420 reductase n=1 Tax=Microbacterium sp. BE35 TaxID=2817773 RepID=UPI00285B4316|nr:NADP oxidoreductase [Microbacterium sp. BE35]MDR7188862.1 putative dinucleotide-binding enzyme [Microbacterium sp. BE35]